MDAHAAQRRHGHALPVPEKCLPAEAESGDYLPQDPELAPVCLRHAADWNGREPRSSSILSFAKCPAAMKTTPINSGAMD